MKIALIGSNSFVSNSLRKYWDADYINFSRKKNDQENWFRFEYPEHPIQTDKLLDCDVVVYTAGAGIQSNIQSSDNHIMEMNANYPIKLFNELKKQNYSGRWISFGSYIEYGINHDALPQESEIQSDKTQLGAYAQSKRKLTEHLLKSTTLNYLHIVIPNVYGYGENPNRLIPYLVSHFSDNIDIKVSNGEKKRQFLHVKDLVDLLKLLLAQNEKGVFNCAPDQHYTIKEVIELIKTLFPNYGGSIKFDSKSSWDQDIMYLGMDNKKVKDIGWKPIITLQQGIKEYLP